jgi:hypothetical protein
LTIKNRIDVHLKRRYICCRAIAPRFCGARPDPIFGVCMCIPVRKHGIGKLDILPIFQQLNRIYDTVTSTRELKKYTPSWLALDGRCCRGVRRLAGGRGAAYTRMHRSSYNPCSIAYGRETCRVTPRAVEGKRRRTRCLVGELQSVGICIFSWGRSTVFVGPVRICLRLPRLCGTS